MDYKSTLNLPKTDFAMQAGLPKREPVMLEKWYEDKVYETVLEKNDGKPLYVLHDGPPYANGDIHLGTALNKTLKDFIVRYKNMSGFKAPYVPGWDTHGLPTELKARKKAGVSNSTAISDIELRKLCREFALGYLDEQRNSFKRLGGIGEWDNPYVTLRKEFEAKQIEIFSEMATKGLIYKGLKPVYWCPECETALAEAEIEYAEDPCHSIYVKFRVTDDKGLLTPMGADLSKTYFVIWTTTTWTLPANVAICVGPEFEYALVKSGDEYYVMATALTESAMQAAGKTDYEILGTLKGSDLEYMKTAHPFIDRTSLVIVGDHVTLESGTGCVHTAPGHGVEDYDVCHNHYPEIPIVVPVDSHGKMTEEAGQFAGLTTEEANKAIAQHLEDTGALFALQKIIHQYPHCWRCKKPVLFRATEQWFCSVDAIKDQAIEAIKGVKWIPGWGEDRISSMVRDRNDWCISRQRRWGVPIPIFYCKDCGEPLIEKDAMHAVSELFRAEGSDAWYIKEAEEILPAGTKCKKCGCTSFTKERDIMDVWFDSGVTHAAVCDTRDYLHWPADLYLEGADQYRGWFQSSLLTAVGAFGQGAPFKECVTHGWTVDGEGKAMHKSLGNGVDPADVFNENGADILRLWAASADYHADVRCSKEIFKQLSQNYLKFRNTCKFMLDNLVDFDPEKLTKPEDMPVLDRWLLTKLNELIEKAEQSYCDYEFHIITHAVNDFCVNTLSSFYLDIVKDRLYCEGAESATRRSAQTALYLTLHTLSKLFAPILAFTCDEIWLAMPHTGDDDARNVVLNEMNKPFTAYALDSETMARWEHIIAVRTVVNGALEEARAAKVIGKSLEADVHLTVPESDRFFADESPEALADIFIVSKVELAIGDALAVKVDNAAGTKCPRCWKHSLEANAEGLCPRCAEVVKHLHLTELL